MPRRKDTFKGGAPIARIRENSRPTRTNESMVDYDQWIPSSVLYGLLGFEFFRNIDSDLENDFIYPDDDDDDIYSHNVTHRPLQPCPRIRQLTDEEADQHAKQLIEEERRKEKAERNKRKKLRKKEKKRLEKENAADEILPEEENGKSDPLKNREENSIIDSNGEANEFPESGKTQNGTEEVGYDESSVNNTNNKEEKNTEMTEKEDEKHKDSKLNNSYSAAESVPKEMCNQRPARARKKQNTKLVEVKQLKEEKPNVVEKSEAPKKEEKMEPNKENTMDPMAEEFAKRSRELAGLGNSLAASGQFKTAVKYFTDAIKYNPKEFKLFGNRSFCCERMQQYENALRDADIALCMEPKWIKGLFRKGKALCGLKRYYEASLIYKEVLLLQSSSVEATQELKRAQTMHLTEMGFTWEQSSEALRTNRSLEEAVESLFGGGNPGPGVASASRDDTDQPVVEEDDDDDEGEWIVQRTNRSRTQQIRGSNALTRSRMKSQSPTPRSRNSVKPELFPIWVGLLAPAVTYATLHELFSRAGTVNSIKMLLEHQCAFVNYTRKEDCDKAIQCINGLVVKGAPLSVRYPNKIHPGLGMSKSAITDLLSRTGLYSKECFFWRTTGCTRLDCNYKHDPKHKNIDRNKVTSGLGNFHM